MSAEAIPVNKRLVSFGGIKGIVEVLVEIPEWRPVVKYGVFDKCSSCSEASESVPAYRRYSFADIDIFGEAAWAYFPSNRRISIAVHISSGNTYDFDVKIPDQSFVRVKRRQNIVFQKQRQGSIAHVRESVIN